MKVYRNVPLKEFNTFGIAARARRLVVIEDDVDLALSPFAANHQSLILGAGSDMVFTQDYNGMVIMLEQKTLVTVDGCNVRAWAGMRMDDLVQWTLDNGCQLWKFWAIWVICSCENWIYFFSKGSPHWRRSINRTSSSRSR